MLSSLLSFLILMVLDLEDKMTVEMAWALMGAINLSLSKAEDLFIVVLIRKKCS